MADGLFIQFDDETIVDGWEFETLQGRFVHTDDAARMIDELGCENLQVIGMLGEDKVPVYAYMGGDNAAFSSATGYDIGREKFMENTQINNEEYESGVFDAKARHMEIIGPKHDLECGPMLLGANLDNTKLTI